MINHADDECPHWETAARPVPDVLEETIRQTLDGDGKVTSVRDVPFTAAAKLRFPVAVAGPEDRSKT